MNPSVKTSRRLLFVYPDFDPTYWGMQHALPLVGRKALMPPLGLMTIAAMTPEQYEVRIVDMNCEALTDEHIGWADMVLFSAMMMQQRTFSWLRNGAVRRESRSSLADLIPLRSRMSAARIATIWF